MPQKQLSGALALFSPTCFVPEFDMVDSPADGAAGSQPRSLSPRLSHLSQAKGLGAFGLCSSRDTQQLRAAQSIHCPQSFKHQGPGHDQSMLIFKAKIRGIF